MKILNTILYIIKRLLHLALIIVIGIILVGGLYFTYQELTGSPIKEELIKKYDFSNFELFTYKTTTYVYEEDANCGSLWFKKCTDNKDLKKEVIFYTKAGIKIKAVQYTDNTIEDDYEED